MFSLVNKLDTPDNPAGTKYYPLLNKLNFATAIVSMIIMMFFRKS